MSRVRTPEPEGFAEFWEQTWLKHMRKNDGRGDARAAYAKALLKGYEPNEINQAAAHYITTLTARDMEFIPLAATWLNREPFDDMLALKAQAVERETKVAALRSSNVTSITKAPELTAEQRAASVAKWERQRGRSA